jgi:glucokinase
MSTGKTCVFACDMGGTYIKSACILEDGSIAGDLRMIPSRSDGQLSDILESWEKTLRSLMETAVEHDLEITGIGISTPGPFDYRRKMSLMKHKFQPIYGIDLEAAIKTHLPLPPVPFIFVQDSNSYLLGEQRYGSAKGIENCTCVTLGTGLGISAMAGGKLLTNGRDSCYIAIYRQPWGDGILEDVISGRGICAAYRTPAGNGEAENITAKEIGRLAREGDPAALEVMERFGAVLGRGIAFHLIHTYSELLVVGGQISRDFSLFQNPLVEALRKDGYNGIVRAAQFPEDAALYGVAASIR